MKIKMLATGYAPDYYDIDSGVITAVIDEQRTNYDLSNMVAGDTATVEPVGSVLPIYHAEHTGGELHVVLCQAVGPGHWTESDWFDAADYDPDMCEVILSDRADYQGRPTVKTRLGVIDMVSGLELSEEENAA